MLSKINYGIIDPKVLAQTIIDVSHIPDVAVAIKPHTRGMKLDFMELDRIGNAIDAWNTPSPLLVEWADLILFTGSGIAFHAMFMNKRVGLLRYCQELETIFDSGESVEVLNAPEDVTTLIAKIRSGEKLAETREQEIREWLKANVESGAPGGDVVTHYKMRIQNDLS